jgi:hypothetical protein
MLGLEPITNQLAEALAGELRPHVRRIHHDNVPAIRREAGIAKACT